MCERKITKDIHANGINIKILRKYFPRCFTRKRQLNVEKFKEELSNTDINFSKESYGMDWLKKSSFWLLSTVFFKESERWNQKKRNKNSEKLFIEKDNLEVLRYLLNSYYEKIKMIYLDFPYNILKDNFIYQDNRDFTSKELSELLMIDEKGYNIQN